jgi:hypothetical protein
VPDEKVREHDFMFKRRYDKHLKGSPEIVKKLDPSLWKLPDGRSISPLVMNRVIVTIKTVDAILRLGERRVNRFSQGLITAALDVVTKHDEIALKVYLKRMSLFKKLTGVPRDAEIVLQRFDAVLKMIMPTEGWGTLKEVDHLESSRELP